jgi:hypothetical protein
MLAVPGTLCIGLAKCSTWNTLYWLIYMCRYIHIAVNETTDASYEGREDCRAASFGGFGEAFA